MVKNNFVPKGPKQTRLYEELQPFILNSPDSVIVTLKDMYSNKLIQSTIHKLGYKTQSKKFKDTKNPKTIKAFKIYKYR